MAIDVNILTVEPTDNTLDITVSVSTSMLDVIDYELNINDTDTGGTVTRSGTLDGKGGNSRGDEVIHEVQFGLNPPGEGTVTAQITSPEEYVGVQDQQSWEKAEGSLAINECDSQPTSNGDLEVTYTLTPSIGAEETEREVTIRVDGQRVGSETHTIPGRTITRTQTIPADDLPIGDEMPVEIEVGGNFSDCGTVTTEADDPAPEPPEPEPPDPEPSDPQITDCGIESEDPLRVGFDVDGRGARGETTAQLRVGGLVVAKKQVNYTLNPISHTIEAPVQDLPTGSNMDVTLSLSG